MQEVTGSDLVTFIEALRGASMRAVINVVGGAALYGR
jgi:hypothetical protein